jgi:hypothetical protein
LSRCRRRQFFKFGIEFPEINDSTPDVPQDPEKVTHCFDELEKLTFETLEKLIEDALKSLIHSSELRGFLFSGVLNCASKYDMGQGHMHMYIYIYICECRHSM